METTVKITDPDHLLELGTSYGLMLALDRLRKVKDSDRLVGFGLALAKLEALEAQQRVQTMQRNLRVLMGSGLDFNTHKVTWSGADELVIQPAGPGEASA